jgi:hypothetical protein
MVQRSSDNSGNSKPIGAIVGGSIGGAALLALIAFGIWFMLRRRQVATTSSATGGEKSHRVDSEFGGGNPFITPPPTAGMKGMQSHSPMGTTFSSHASDGPTQYALVPPSSPASASYNQSSITPPPTSPRSAISITQRSVRSDARQPSPAQERQDLIQSPVGHMFPQGAQHHASLSTDSNYVVEPLILPPSPSLPHRTKAQMLSGRQQQQGRDTSGAALDSPPPPEYSSGGNGTTIFTPAGAPPHNFRDTKSATTFSR